jgi:hypothetical protein
MNIPGRIPGILPGRIPGRIEVAIHTFRGKSQELAGTAREFALLRRRG